MNISLAGVGKSKKKKAKPTAIGFGLNQRSGGKKVAATNVFGGDDDDDDDNEGEQQQSKAPGDARAVVNQALRKEQEALRQRAQKAMQQAQSGEIYDYDGAYDTFKQPPAQDKKEQSTEEKKSRYIGELLKSAEERKLDRDIAHERKVAREQQREEEENVELRGKERFVTASYKRKLEERKLWQDEQDKRHKQEEDVTKKEGGIANFYGNFNQNVSMGGAPVDEKKELPKKPDISSESSNPATSNGLGFLDGFEPSGDDKNEIATDEPNGMPSDDATPSETQLMGKPKQSIDPEQLRLERRKAREEKVAQAKIRYMQRHGIEA